MNPRYWQWEWLGWQVLAPIVLPIAISAGVVSLWEMGPSSFPIEWDIVFDDVSPWALSFYCFTLIFVTMHDFWPKLPAHPVLGASLVVAAISVTVYASFIVIWRHIPQFHVGTKLWQMAFIFLAVVVCVIRPLRTGRRRLGMGEAGLDSREETHSLAGDARRDSLERESLAAGAAGGAAVGSVVGLATSAAFGPLIGAIIGAGVGAGLGHVANAALKR